MNRIEVLAERLRVQLGIPDDIRPNSLDVLRRLKFAKVITDFREDTDQDQPGRQARWDSEQRIIFLSPSLWGKIQGDEDVDARFTVFHEIGHAVLGHNARNRLSAGRPQFGRSVESDEEEADEFARALAIPLYFASSASTSSVAALAIQFGLPPGMASRRLVDLQRFIRSGSTRATDKTTGEDNYAEAMRLMRINALNWNS